MWQSRWEYLQRGRMWLHRWGELLQRADNKAPCQHSPRTELEELLRGFGGFVQLYACSICSILRVTFLWEKNGIVHFLHFYCDPSKWDRQSGDQIKIMQITEGGSVDWGEKEKPTDESVPHVRQKQYLQFLRWFWGLCSSCSVDIDNEICTRLSLFFVSREL